ncbi:MAG: hypothetical protein ABIR96_09885 [Bdellovibrionota bacterium]
MTRVLRYLLPQALLLLQLFACNATTINKALKKDEPAVIAPDPVVVPVPTKLGFTGPTTINLGLCTSTAFIITLLNASDVATATETLSTISLSGVGSGAFYTAAGCGGASTTSVTIPAGATSVSVYFKDNTLDALTLNAHDVSGLLTDATLSRTVTSLAPASVSISTTVPLAEALYSANGPVVPSATAPLTPTGAGTTPSTAVATPTAAILTPTGTGLTASAGSGTQPTGTIPTPYNATLGTPIDVTVTTSFPAAATPACTVKAPFAAIGCTPSTFTVPASGGLTPSPAGSMNFQIRAKASNALASDYRDSNTLTAQQIIYRQVSNTYNNNTTGDTFTNAMAVYNGKLYFQGNNSVGFTKLFAYDPTGTGTLTQISNICGSTCNDNPTSLTVFSGKLYFAASSTNTNWGKLYSYTDASGGSITQISNTFAGSNDNIQTANNTINFTIVGSNMYFVASISGGYQKLFQLTSAGVLTQVCNSTGTVAANSAPSQLTVHNGKLFFVANAAGGFSKIFSWDGTTAYQLTNTVNNAGASDFPTYLTSIGTKLYFVARNASNVPKIFVYNDVATPTLTQFSNLRNDATLTDNPGYLTVYNSKLYFSALSLLGVSKLFVSDGTTITQLSNTRKNNNASDAIFGITGPSAYQLFYVYNARMYFNATNSANKSKLFEYNDSTGLVRQVSNSRSDGSDSATSIVGYNNKLYFFSIRAVIGFNTNYKIYSFDPATSEFLQVTDTTQGQEISNDYYTTTSIMTLANRIYFLANNLNNATKIHSICDTTTGCTD